MNYTENPFAVDQIGLREEFIAALKKNPKSIWEISRETKTAFSVVKKFGEGEFVSNKVALKLRKYLEEELINK